MIPVNHLHSKKTDMAADTPELKLLGTSTLSAPVTGGHLACNPAIDLTATVGEGGTALHVWRANDQLVSKHTERGKKVEGIRWKEDGIYTFSFVFLFDLPKSLFSPSAYLGYVGLRRGGCADAEKTPTGEFLAAGWSDGVVRLLGLESSKAVHHIPVCDGDAAAARIGFISWSRNVTGESKRRRRRRRAARGEGGGQRKPERGVLLDGERTSDVALDLPHELTFLEIETALPKLSPLPVSGGSG